eukprot:82546-Chlamydomonas_euryale.AAC.4
MTEQHDEKCVATLSWTASEAGCRVCDLAWRGCENAACMVLARLPWVCSHTLHGQAHGPLFTFSHFNQLASRSPLTPSIPKPFITQEAQVCGDLCSARCSGQLEGSFLAPWPAKAPQAALTFSCGAGPAFGKGSVAPALLSSPCPGPIPPPTSTTKRAPARRACPADISICHVQGQACCDLQNCTQDHAQAGRHGA